MFGSRETLNSLILKAPQEWHTQVALPFVRIEGTTVEWDELRFDVRLLQRVPYEGAPLAPLPRSSRSPPHLLALGRCLAHANFAAETP